MSLTPDAHHDDEELRRYVLGLLPDDQTERLDEASVADDEVATRLRSIETDLLDAYARRQLVGSTLERFETYYLSSPLRRERATAAARFIRGLDRAVGREEPATWIQRIPRAVTVARYSAVAGLLIFVSAIVIYQATGPRIEPRLATQGPSAPQKIQADAGSRTTEPPAAPADQPRVARGRIVAITLSPPTRSIAPVPSLIVPPDADRVRFNLVLESNDFSDYRVVLSDPTVNRPAWRSEWVKPLAPEAASVSVLVPATLLKFQHYALDLTGRLDSGRVEVIGSYPVRIDKP